MMKTADDIAAYGLKKPGTSADFPFDTVTLVLRVGKKIFALIATESAPVRVNLKSEPSLAADLRDRYPAAILPGYHMNKLHWNSVILDGSLPDSLIRDMIDQSYDIVRASLPKSQRPAP